MFSAATPTGDVEVDSRWMVLLCESTPTRLWRCHEVAKAVGVTVAFHFWNLGENLWSLHPEKVGKGGEARPSPPARSKAAVYLSGCPMNFWQYRRCFHKENSPSSASLQRTLTQRRKEMAAGAHNKHKASSGGDDLNGCHDTGTRLIRLSKFRLCVFRVQLLWRFTAPSITVHLNVFPQTAWRASAEGDQHVVAVKLSQALSFWGFFLLELVYFKKSKQTKEDIDIFVYIDTSDLK